MRLDYNCFSTCDKFCIHIDMFYYSIFYYSIIPSFLFAIILNVLTFMSFVSFETHIFGDKTFQLRVHLFKLIMKGSYLSSAARFISINLDLTMHG